MIVDVKYGKTHNIECICTKQLKSIDFGDLCLSI